MFNLYKVKDLYMWLQIFSIWDLKDEKGFQIKCLKLNTQKDYINRINENINIISFSSLDI